MRVQLADGPAFMVFHQDLSERQESQEELKRNERLLRESEKCFRVAFERAGIGITNFDFEGHFVPSNAAPQTTLARSGTDLEKMRWSDYSHPDDRTSDGEMFQQILAAKRLKYQSDRRFIRRDGTTIWGRLTGTFGRDPDGEALYGMEILEDTTDQKEAESNLHVAQELNRRIVEAAAQGVWAIDANE